jgi:5-methyltetrahydropteroyltriglutamate--homocysteine methyltransferase
MARDFGLLPTTVVGSYPQPDALIDRGALEKVPRVRLPNVWKVPREQLAAAQDDATIAAIRDQEQAGVDIVSDGEMRRESYSNHFSNALAGIDEQVGTVTISNDGHSFGVEVPDFSSAVRRLAPVEVENARFLNAHTDRVTKMTLPGPFTMAQQAVTSFYPSRRELALALADAVRAEIVDLFAAGIDIVQIDEPWMQRFPEDARSYGVEVVNRALDGVDGTVALHICFGYAATVSAKPSRYDFLAELEDTPLDHISIEGAQPQLDLSSLAGILPSKRLAVGVIDLSNPQVESPETVADRITRLLEVIPAERLMLAPDCGMKFLPRNTALGKLTALARGAEIARARLSSD